MSQRLAKAEIFIRDQTALYRHYAINEVQRHVRQHAGVDITDSEAVSIVQRIRNEKSMGAIAANNMPGYQCSEEEEDAAIKDIEKMSSLSDGNTSSLWW